MAEGSHTDIPARRYRVLDEIGHTDWDDGPLLSEGEPSMNRRARDWDEWDNAPTSSPVQHHPVHSTSFPMQHQVESTYSPIRRHTEPPHYPSHQRPVSRKDRKPDRYDGSTPWRQYLVHFEAITALNGWTEEDAATELAACLRGSACRVLYPKPTSQDGRERAFMLPELLE
jgi:hypothetical protein